MRPLDQAAVRTLEAALLEARANGDERPALVVLAVALAELGVPPGVRSSAPMTLVAQRRDEWLRRLESSGRSRSARVGYRVALDELLAWAAANGRSRLDEQVIVDHLRDYRRARRPAPATYHRRFVLLRRFARWLTQRDQVPDPFASLDAPPKPVQESDWLTPREFAALLAAAANPRRRRRGMAERDRLVLVTLVITGLRRSELIALDWRDLALDDDRPSLLVRHGKGNRARRQALPQQLAAELRAVRDQRNAGPEDPVFCGLAGGRLQPKVLAEIVHRCAKRAQLSKKVTAHTLRHTAATWLRQGAADTRLVAEYLGHADLSTVARYAHVGDEELHAAVATLAHRAGL
jgi:site-specific recombinase XerD